MARLPIKTESAASFIALGKHLKELRQNAEMTQRDVAIAVGVSQQAIYAYERGTRRTSILILARIADVLNVAIGDVVELKKPRSRINDANSETVRIAWRLQRLSKSKQRYVIRLITLCELVNQPRRRR